MLEQEEADGFVLATGHKTKVRDFITAAAKALDLNLEWSGEGEKTIATDTKSGKVIVNVDPQFFRPAEVELLLGDATKAKEKLGWEPKVQLEELTDMMVRADYDRIKSGSLKF